MDVDRILEFTPVPTPSRDALRKQMQAVATMLMQKFRSVACIFRYFDIKLVGSVTFSDFSFGLDNLKSGYDRDTQLQMFTYLDANRDGILRFADFCQLVNLSGAGSLSKSVNHLFGRKQIEVKCKIDSRRNRPDNFLHIKTVSCIDDSEFISQEVERYSKRSTINGNMFHSPN